MIQPIDEIPKALVHIDDPSGLVEIDAASKAIVYLSVDWSFQGQNARKKFFLFVESLVNEMPDSGISFFILEEDQAFVRSWLGLKRNVKMDYVSGCGSIAWLDHGKVVGWTLSALWIDLRVRTTRAFGI